MTGGHLPRTPRPRLPQRTSPMAGIVKRRSAMPPSSFAPDPIEHPPEGAWDWGVSPPCNGEGFVPDFSLTSTR